MVAGVLALLATSNYENIIHYASDITFFKLKDKGASKYKQSKLFGFKCDSTLTYIT